MTAAILGLIGSAMTAVVAVWKMLSDRASAENTPAMQQASQAQQQVDFAQQAAQVHAKADLDKIRDLESE
jgi:hypothetical protein